MVKLLLYTVYYSNSLKVTALDMLQKHWIHTPLTWRIGSHRLHTAAFTY